MIFVKNLNFFLFFRQKKTWKKYLLMFYIGRKAFKVKKISTFKNRIFGIFPKWLSHNFCLCSLPGYIDIDFFKVAIFGIFLKGLA